MWLNARIRSRLIPALRPKKQHRRRKPAWIMPTTIELLESRLVLSATANNVLLFSLAGGSGIVTLPAAGTVGGSDIIAYNGSTFELYFQGADVGLGAADIDAFALVSDTEILLSFASSVTIDGLGTVDGSDLVLFSATSLGENTAGTFSLYFDGSQFGLGAAANANIDAVEYLDDGRLLISTSGDVSLSTPSGTLSVADEDLLEFTPSAAGPVTSGSWSLYFDGSDVQLTLATEDVDAVALNSNGNILLSTSGSFFVPSFGGDNEDVFEFTPTSLGGTTAGTFVQTLFFDGSVVEPLLIPLDVDAIDMRVVAPPPTPINQAPIADAQSLATSEDREIVIQLTGDDGNPESEQPLTFVIVNGPQHGTLSGFNAATGEVIYTPNENYHGTDSFTFLVIDNPGGSQQPLSSAVAAVSIGVTAVNDVPTITAPAAEQVGDEGETMVIHGIAVGDVDAATTNDTLEVRLTAVSGRITLATGVGGVQSIAGNGTGIVIIRGTLAGINATLWQGVQYMAVPGFVGLDTLSIRVDDLGNGGTGGSLSAVAAVNVRVNEIIESDPLHDLKADVQALIDSKKLPAKLGNSLLQKLDLQGNRADALKLSAFIVEVQLYRLLGYLTRDQARSLTSQAEAILDDVKICGGWFSWWWHPRGWNPPRFGMKPLDLAFANHHWLFRGR